MQIELPLLMLTNVCNGVLFKMVWAFHITPTVRKDLLTLHMFYSSVEREIGIAKDSPTPNEGILKFFF